MTKVLLVVAALAVTVSTADATPGAVNAQGCHGRNGPQGYHCHKRPETSKFTTKNRRYVQWGG